MWSLKIPDSFNLAKTVDEELTTTIIAQHAAAKTLQVLFIVISVQRSLFWVPHCKRVPDAVLNKCESAKERVSE